MHFLFFYFYFQYQKSIGGKLLLLDKKIDIIAKKGTKIAKIFYAPAHLVLEIFRQVRIFL